MEYVILGLLMLKPMTLYELNAAFRGGISLFYSASYGSLQNAVKKLLKSEWVEIEEGVENGRNKKIYSISEAGRAAFYAWMHSESYGSKLEVTALAKLYFLGLMASIVERKQILENIIRAIESEEQSLSDLCRHISQIKMDESQQAIFKYQLKTLEYGMMTHAQAKQWFTARLDELQ